MTEQVAYVLTGGMGELPKRPYRVVFVTPRRQERAKRFKTHQDALRFMRTLRLGANGRLEMVPALMVKQ